MVVFCDEWRWGLWLALAGSGWLVVVDPFGVNLNQFGHPFREQLFILIMAILLSTHVTACYG